MDWSGRWGDDQLWTHYVPITDEAAARVERIFDKDRMNEDDSAWLDQLLHQRRLVHDADPTARLMNPATRLATVAISHIL